MTGQTILFVALAIGLGGLWAFAGYRAFILLLAIAGFLAGFGLGSALAPVLLPNGPDGAAVVVGIVAGILVALFARHLFHVGVSLLAGLLGAWGVTVLAGPLGVEPSLVPIVALVAGIVTAVLACVIQASKWLVIALTSIAGAASIVAGGLVLAGRVQPSDFWAGAAGLTGLRFGPELIVLGPEGIVRTVVRVITVPADILASQPVAIAAIIAVALLGAFFQARGLGLLPGRALVPRAA